MPKKEIEEINTQLSVMRKALVVPVKALQDNDGHWYVVPVYMVDKFHELLEKSQYSDSNDDWVEFEDLFINTFSKHETGGDVNNTQLYIVAENL